MAKEDKIGDIEQEYLAARKLAFAILWQCVKDLRSKNERLRKDAQVCIQSDYIEYLCHMLGIDYPTFLKLSTHYARR